MDFKLDGKTLCIDLRKSSQEEIMLIISTVASTCKLLEKAGYKPIIKATEDSNLKPSNKQYVDSEGTL